MPRTAKEEQVCLDHQAAQPTGQQQQEPLLFYNTPPSWPFGSSSKRPFIIYYESVKYSDEAKAWPNGDMSYAKGKWDAMSADEHAVYAEKGGEARRQAWVDSYMRVPTIRY
ncbi:uncharacterized protein SPSK_06765 [Sporothrix schenckii 1099-18]|uniref:Uncharacterized protein n=1 Tax=Sporothrix schenckii 1099-18 TaxID=1397361 RepID=A0A0F2MNQ9_SPOSC|nr:uncharacterized protein SPSK_06765 [Sporothrix schenckii 1099-18]KJR89826.1 hypothetical protein SPSK_06765 [Sporothrix schenckii 1099-18]